MSQIFEPSEFQYRVGGHFSEARDVLVETELSQGEKRAILEDWKFRLEARMARLGASDTVRQKRETLTLALRQLGETEH